MKSSFPSTGPRTATRDVHQAQRATHASPTSPPTTTLTFLTTVQNARHSETLFILVHQTPHTQHPALQNPPQRTHTDAETILESHLQHPTSKEHNLAPSRNYTKPNRLPPRSQTPRPFSPRSRRLRGRRTAEDRESITPTTSRDGRR